MVARYEAVAVLFHERPSRWKGLRPMARRIEEELGDTLTEVRLAVGRANAHQLNQTDCAIIATVSGTKGLEFDAVVVIDPLRVWKRPLERISDVRRNGLYVAASRARQGLSLLVDDRSELLRGDDLIDHAEYVET